MKKAIIVITTAVLFVSCRSKEEKTAAASTTQPQPVVVEKVKYVPVQTNTASPATNTNSNKQGWSKAAKGTAIGAGGGALVGATVSNNKAAGAVIGGAIGAGTGYLIGRGEDKKDGRVKPKNKQ
ncbi:MAG: glycine zipper domain-containing protein [Chitinophagaceae bacterium]